MTEQVTVIDEMRKLVYEDLEEGWKALTDPRQALVDAQAKIDNLEAASVKSTETIADLEDKVSKGGQELTDWYKSGETSSPSELRRKVGKWEKQLRSEKRELQFMGEALETLRAELAEDGGLRYDLNRQFNSVVRNGIQLNLTEEFNRHLQVASDIQLLWQEVNNTFSKSKGLTAADPDVGLGEVMDATLLAPRKPIGGRNIIGMWLRGLLNVIDDDAGGHLSYERSMENAQRNVEVAQRNAANATSVEEAQAAQTELGLAYQSLNELEKARGIEETPVLPTPDQKSEVS
jgi:hypothetical protein